MKAGKSIAAVLFIALIVLLTQPPSQAAAAEAANCKNGVLLINYSHYRIDARVWYLYPRTTNPETFVQVNLIPNGGNGAAYCTYPSCTLYNVLAWYDDNGTWRMCHSPEFNTSSCRYVLKDSEDGRVSLTAE